MDKFSLQSFLKDLDMAYKNFFREIKKGNNNYGFSRFKNKKFNHKLYKTKFTNGNIMLFEKSIKLPKLGYVKCKTSIMHQGRILNATISQEPSGKYYVSVCCTDVVIVKLPPSNNSIGIDLGIKEFCTTSSGNMISNPKHLKSSLDKLARLQK